MLIACESNPMTAMLVPSDTAAVSRGSAIASSDPNTTNSTTAAARKPKLTPLESLLRRPSRAICPSTSNSTPLREPAVILVTKALAAALPILFGATSKVTLANATWADGAIWRAPPGA